MKQTMQISVAMALVLGLAACDENGALSFAGGSSAAGETAADASGQSVQLVERDVEAPEVFQVTETGLWDGRPSLGGVWVAHPDVTDPERVIIRNQTNDKFVIGALFRRERDNPGPALQVSSDAAETLGMLAGGPATLNVTALRREEAAPVEPTAGVTTEFETPDSIAATPLDPIAGATAAIVAAETTAADTQIAAEPTPVVATAPAPVAASSLSKPFIQIGIFSVEENANNTATSLRRDGMSASVLAQQSQGRSFWRVIVGPAPTESDRAAVLDKVKALGFADAYFVSN